MMTVLQAGMDGQVISTQQYKHLLAVPPSPVLGYGYVTIITIFKTTQPPQMICTTHCLPYTAINETNHSALMDSNSIAHFWYSCWAAMYKTTDDEAPGKQWILLMVLFCFPGASFSVVLCMVTQPEYQKWAI